LHLYLQSGLLQGEISAGFLLHLCLRTWKETAVQTCKIR